MARPIPLPEKRRKPTLAILVTVFLRQGVPCACCGERLDPEAYDMDHIQPLDALGRQDDPGNWQALCPACHAIKSAIDNRRAKKGARIRGETGPLKRMREVGPLLHSRNDFADPRRISPPIPKNRFQTRLTRGLDGIVRPR